jgi:hypothetical protein
LSHPVWVGTFGGDLYLRYIVSSDPRYKENRR